MFNGSSIGEWIARLFKNRPLTEISPELRRNVETRFGNEKILHCLRVEKSFYKNISSFAGETFFRTVAVLTDRKLLLLKDSTAYHEIRFFLLSTVSGCSLQSDSGKPALVVSLFDGSAARFLFAKPDPEIGVFENTIERALSEMRQNPVEGAFCVQCGKQTQPGAAFCGACGVSLAFAASENKIGD